MGIYDLNKEIILIGFKYLEGIVVVGLFLSF